MIENNLLRWIIFAPLAGAIINWLIGRKLKNEMFSGVVACATIAISTIIAFYLAFVADGGALRIEKPILDHIWTWITWVVFVPISPLAWTGCREFTPASSRLSASSYTSLRPATCTATKAFTAFSRT